MDTAAKKLFLAVLRAVRKAHRGTRRAQGAPQGLMSEGGEADIDRCFSNWQKETKNQSIVLAAQKQFRHLAISSWLQAGQAKLERRSMMYVRAFARRRPLRQGARHMKQHCLLIAKLLKRRARGGLVVSFFSSGFWICPFRCPGSCEV